MGYEQFILSRRRFAVESFGGQPGRNWRRLDTLQISTLETLDINLILNEMGALHPTGGNV